MKWENVLQMIFSAPAILLDIIVKGLREFFIEEIQLYKTEEVDDDDPTE